MTMIRTEKQVALQNLLVTLSETIELYEDAAQYLVGAELSKTLSEIVGKRKVLISSLQNAVRDSGDLPATPDPDKETLKKLLAHLYATLADDTAAQTLRNCITAEDQLSIELAECRQAGLEAQYSQLLIETADNIASTKMQLQNLLEKHQD